MKVGIIGCGNISETYFNCQKIFNNFEITACADINKEFATKVLNNLMLRLKVLMIFYPITKLA